jgi:hypothetical protein
MITSFDWREDKEFGHYGWIMTGMPDFNASTGLGIAHDTLEHFANGDGSLTDEMMAFGAMMYIRGEGGYFDALPNNNNVPHLQLGGDICRFLQDERRGSIHIRKPPRTYSIGEMDSEIQLSIKEGVRLANSELDDGDTPFSTGEVTDRMIGWMRIGYRKAERRYCNAAPIYLAHLFTEIRDTVDRQFKHGEEGEKLIVKVCQKSLKFRIYREEPDYGDDY